MIDYTAEQITNSILKAVRDGQPPVLIDTLRRLLAVHYPDAFEALDLAVTLARVIKS